MLALVTGRQVLAVSGNVLRWVCSCICKRMEIDSGHGGYIAPSGNLRRSDGDGDV